MLNYPYGLEAQAKKSGFFFYQWVKVELGVFTCHHQSLQQWGIARLCPNKDMGTVCDRRRLHEDVWGGEMEKGGCGLLVETVWESKTPQYATTWALLLDCNTVYWLYDHTTKLHHLDSGHCVSCEIVISIPCMDCLCAVINWSVSQWALLDVGRLKGMTVGAKKSAGEQQRYLHFVVPLKNCSK